MNPRSVEKPFKPSVKTEPPDIENSCSLSLLECGKSDSHKRTRIKSKTKLKVVNGEPQLWRQHLTNILEMRKHRDAPVDSMGCDVISDKNASPRVFYTSANWSFSLYL